MDAPARSFFNVLKASSLCFPPYKRLTLSTNCPQWFCLAPKLGIHLKLKPTRPRKLLASKTEEERTASFTACTFSLVGPIPCLERRIPIKTSLLIPKVNFLLFKVRNCLVCVVHVYSKSYFGKWFGCYDNRACPCGGDFYPLFDIPL